MPINNVVLYLHKGHAVVPGRVVELCQSGRHGLHPGQQPHRGVDQGQPEAVSLQAAVQLDRVKIGRHRETPDAEDEEPIWILSERERKR